MVGNQNAGKTTLFNALTGMNATVGNWPGVTIERKEGQIKGAPDCKLVDTPGVYSLSPYTDEEKVTRAFCLNSHPDLIINIIDATSLERSLYLTTQLAELSTDVIVALNMADILESRGITINDDKLSEELGLTVVRISAKTNEGIDNLIKTIAEGTYKKNPHLKIYANDVQKELTHLEGDLNTELEESGNPKFAAVKLFEGDPFFQALNNSSTEKEIQEIESKYDMDAEQIVADQRYDFVTKVKHDCCSEKPMRESVTDRLDRVFLNKWAAIPIFILIMGLVYFLSVGVVGSLTSDFIDALFNGSETIGVFFNEIPFAITGLGPLLGQAIVNSGGSVWSADLVQSGAIAGISAVLTFVPQLAMLFLSMAILEASGYMNRIAFFLDKIFKKFGLSGKSIIPFIVGTGCSVPGIMSARTVENKDEREMTIMLTPFIPCSAKLPIITVFASVLSPTYGWLISLSLYFLSIVIVLISAIILKKLNKHPSDSSFISELPAYKLPNPKYAMREVGEKTWSFIERAATVIFFCSIVVWVLTRFTWTWEYVGPASLGAAETNIDRSMLADIGKGLAYLFIPAWGGVYSWGATVSAIQGLIAKEQVISSLSVIAGENITTAMTSSGSLFYYFTMRPLAAYSFMVFNLFSAPCVAALAAMRKELGSRKAMAKAIGLELAWAYAMASFFGIVAWGIGGWRIIGL
ncbi:MAG: ferrous iron transport protein B [Bacilli bacterium]|nr:ferrous iron transport protein B [Bacilli bacterium]